MNIPDQFRGQIDEDIKRLSCIANATYQEKIKLHREIDGRYQSCIINWNAGMWGAKETGASIDYRFLDYERVTDNLQIMKAKLETFKFGVNKIPASQNPATNITVNNNVLVSITFDQVRSQVEEMTSLTDEQTQEILDKISEIEDVVNSTDKKKTKWEKIKPVLSWLANKSFDVGMKVLPLILKIDG